MARRPGFVRSARSRSVPMKTEHRSQVERKRNKRVEKERADSHFRSRTTCMICWCSSLTCCSKRFRSEMSVSRRNDVASMSASLDVSASFWRLSRSSFSQWAFNSSATKTTTSNKDMDESIGRTDIETRSTVHTNLEKKRGKNEESIIITTEK